MLGVDVDDEGAHASSPSVPGARPGSPTGCSAAPAISPRSRGTGQIDQAIARLTSERLDIDAAGLDEMDRRLLRSLSIVYDGGPVGVETLAAALSEPRDTIEDVYEPYLLQIGMLGRTPRGRMATRRRTCTWASPRKSPPPTPSGFAFLRRQTAEHFANRCYGAANPTRTDRRGEASHAAAGGDGNA